MAIRLDKREFAKMERAVLYLQENAQSEQAIHDIEEAFKNCFDVDVHVTVINPPPNSPWFVMSVFPDKSTTDKIVDAVMRNESEKVIQKIWEKTTNWYLEIDGRIFKSSPKFTEKELVAVMLHEFGHIAITNSISRRIGTILRVKVAMLKMEDKLLLKDKIFKKVLSLPIINACISTNSKDSVKEEMKADSYVVKAGYKKELASALKKLMSTTKFNNPESQMDEVMHFAAGTIEQFRQRRDHLVRESVNGLLDGISYSPYLEDAIREMYGFILENPVYEESVSSINHIEWCHQQADKIIAEGPMMEGVFGKTHLKRLNPTDIDYVDVKTMQCKTPDDKMMLISFCRSKIDMIDYYMSILQNPDLAKKYRIDNTLPELQIMKTRYLNAIEEIKKFKLPIFGPGMLIKWPEGYEG